MNEQMSGINVMDAVRAAYPAPDVTLVMAGDDDRPYLYQFGFSTPSRGECMAIFTVSQVQALDLEAWLERGSKTLVANYRLDNVALYSSSRPGAFGMSSPMGTASFATIDEAIWNLIASVW